MGILEEDLMRASASDGRSCRRLFPRIIITIITRMIFFVAPSILAQGWREQVDGVV
jgi:hypothetical protein